MDIDGKLVSESSCLAVWGAKRHEASVVGVAATVDGLPCVVEDGVPFTADFINPLVEGVPDCGTLFLLGCSVRSDALGRCLRFPRAYNMSCARRFLLA